MKPLFAVLLLLIFGGLVDTLYLTYEHFSNTLPPCSVSAFADCGRVLQSDYAVVFGVPLALLGAMHYGVMFALALLAIKTKRMLAVRLLFLSTAVGLVVSFFLIYLQLFVIGAICIFCMVSAFVSISAYIVTRLAFAQIYQVFQLRKIEVIYNALVKPFLFLLDPEFVHNTAMIFGELFGRIGLFRWLMAKVFVYRDLRLRQKLENIIFKNPVGLAAGYDYEAAFPQILPVLGFGFETIGTITHKACEGNAKPRLGRLPRSRSLLVNKGFRNPGAQKIVQKLEGQSFEVPVGISIGTTNTSSIKTLQDAISDIVSAFTIFEKSRVKHAYYELNISCPNLKVTVSFYAPNNLKDLLESVSKLKLKKPVFIKMPIEKSDNDVKKMLDVIVKYHFVKGVIFGNLQKNRKDPAIVPEEAARAGKGNFSGKPTWKRSNELIRLAYKKHGKKLIIIGCGGVFSAEDAYTKIRLGASLVQLITGMIFEGPQRITQINQELVQLLKRDGYNHVSEAVGEDA